MVNHTLRQGLQLSWLVGKGQHFSAPGSLIWRGMRKLCTGSIATLHAPCGHLQNEKISLRPPWNCMGNSTRSMFTRRHVSSRYCNGIFNKNFMEGCHHSGLHPFLNKQDRQNMPDGNYGNLELRNSQLPPMSAFSTWHRRYKEVSENDDTRVGSGKVQYQYKNWRTLLSVPNLLTVSRVILTPYLGHLVLIESYPAACGWFLYAGITDVLDGWIARRYPSQATPVGSFMDPLADKFLVSTLFITLTMVNLIPVPLTCLVVSRDVSLIAAAFYVRTISLPPPVTLAAIFDITNQTAELKPTLISKANTAIQLGLVAMTLAAPVVNCVDHPALQALWYITAATTLWSGIGYIFAKDTFRIYKQHRLKQKQR